MAAKGVGVYVSAAPVSWQTRAHAWPQMRWVHLRREVGFGCGPRVQTFGSLRLWWPPAGRIGRFSTGKAIVPRCLTDTTLLLLPKLRTSAHASCVRTSMLEFSPTYRRRSAPVFHTMHHARFPKGWCSRRKGLIPLCLCRLIPVQSSTVAYRRPCFNSLWSFSVCWQLHVPSAPPGGWVEPRARLEKPPPDGQSLAKRTTRSRPIGERFMEGNTPFVDSWQKRFTQNKVRGVRDAGARPAKGPKCWRKKYQKSGEAIEQVTCLG